MAKYLILSHLKGMKGKHVYTSLLLRLLVLISSTGVYIDAHFCCGDLNSLAFYHEAESCFMKAKDVEFSKIEKGKEKIHKKTCCGYGSVFAKQILETKDGLSVLNLNIANNPPLSFIPLFKNALPVVNNYFDTTINIKPPEYVFIRVSRSILYQIFRN